MTVTSVAPAQGLKPRLGGEGARAPDDLWGLQPLVRRAAALAASLMLTVIVVIPLHAQDAAGRRFIAGVLATLAQANTPSLLPAPAGCGDTASAKVRLCQGLIMTRLAELTTDKVAAIRARDLLEGVVAEQPTWPSAWYGLGVARIQAARAGVSPREGPLQPKDVPNSTGAESALIRALEVDSTFVLAAEALALASIRTDSSSRLTDRAMTLRWARKLLPPAGLYGEALVEREAHHPDVAVEVWRLLLQKGGVARGLVELQLARDLYGFGKPAEGREHLLAGASDTAELSRRAYRDQLDLVASWAELAQWDSTPAPQRSAWLRDFWALRDVRAGQPDNARLIEHYVRLDNVFVEFRYTYPSTERLLAADIRKRPCSSMRCAEHSEITTVLDYYVDDVAASLGSKRPFREFTSTQDRLDDRGLVYIRQGMPLAAMRTTDGPGYELWKYERAGTPFYLSFSPHLLPKHGLNTDIPWDIKQVLALGDIAGEPPAPAMLIPTIAGRAPIRLYGDFCALKHSLCYWYGDSATWSADPMINCAAEGGRFRYDIETVALQYPGGRIPGGPFAIGPREREEGFWIDSVATNFDAYPLTFNRLLSPAIELHALDRATGGSPRLVIAFAIPAPQLPRDSLTVNRHTVSHVVHLQVAAYRRSDGKRIDLDTTGTFGPARALVRDEYLAGVVEMPVPPGEYTTSIVFTQDDSSGAVVHRDGVVVPGFDNTLRVSDVVLSRAGGDIQWNSGATTVALNPLTTYTKGTDADLYFQLSGMTRGKKYESSFQFTRIDEDSARSQPFTIAFTQAATGDRAEVIHNLGLKTLEVGKYRITVVVRGEGNEARATGCLTIVK
jgi:hypothetical protein